MTAIWICPNVDSDFLSIFERPEDYEWLWALLRESGGGWKFHHAHLEPGWHTPQRPPLKVPYEAIRDVGAFKTLQDRLVSTAAELPIIKSWDKAGERCRDIGRICADAIADAGGFLNRIFGDEPYTWSTGGAWVKPDPFYVKNGKPDYAMVDGFWATYYRELHGYGVSAVELTESTPNNPPAFFIDRCRALAALDALPDGFLWDGEAVGQKQASQQLSAMGMRVGVIVCPNGTINTSRQFSRSMLAMNGRLLKAVGTASDNVQFESWHCTSDEGKAGKEGTVLLPWPDCLPQDDPLSMLGVVRTSAPPWG